MESPTPACLTCGSRITGPLALDTCTACRLEAALVDPIAEDPEAPGLAPGVLERLGDYELLEEIGRGGMGVIYKARQVHLRRLVAIKMLLAGEFADATTRRRLLREAQAAAQLQHPNIVSVHDVGESNGRAYFVMEYVPGRNLTQAMRQGLFPIARSARYVRELAAAIQYAHDRGVVHRDLKPSNILLDPEDRLKLADFGLNKWLADDSESMTTVSSGTPSFMAPEQVQGVSGISGKHTDIFGLGGILYFLLAGRPPFMGSTIAETLRAVLESDPIPPSSIRPGIPRDLEAVCLKCLEKDPARRYRSAAELAEDLDRWINHLPVRAKPSTPLDHSLKWLRRRPLVAALGAACVLSLVCGAAGIVWQWRKAVDHAASAELHAYLAGVNLAHTDWRENNLGRMRETLAELHPSRDRGIEWDLLHKWANAAQLTVQAYPVGINGLSLSPDGSRVAVVGMDTDATLWEFPSGKQVSRWDGHQTWVASVAFSPDGRRLASGGGDHHILVRNVDNGETLRFIHEAHAHIVRGLAWTPDGSRLISAGFDGFTCIWDASTGARILEMQPVADQVPALSLACSPDGQQILTGHGDGTSRLRSTTDGRENVVFREQPGAINSVAFHPSGNQVASGSSDGTICVWNAANGQLIHHFRPRQGLVHGLAFSHDGGRLASAHSERVALVWDLGTGRELFSFRGHALDLNAVAFSKDDRQLITGSVDGTLRFWDATTDPRGKLLADAASEPVSMGISPDGNIVAVAHRSGVIHAYDSASLRRVFTIPGTHELGSMTYLPRSGRILTIGLTGKATIWDPSTRSILQDWELGPPGELVASVSPDEEWLATTGPASAAGVWNLRTRQWAFRLTGHGGTVYAISFSPDSRRLLTCGEDWTARIWEVPSGNEMLRVEKHENLVLGGAFSPDGNTCLTSGSDGTVVLWDAHSGQSLHRYDSRTVGSRRVRSGGGVHEVGFLADGSRIFTADTSSVLHLWHPALQKETLRLTLDGATRVQVDPRNRFLLTLSSEVRFWPTATPVESAQWLAEQAKAARQP